MRFAKKLYDFIDAKKNDRGWQAKFAEKANITPNSFHKIVTGLTKDPSLSTVSKIIDAIEDSGESLCGEIRRPGANAPVEGIQGKNLKVIPVYQKAGAGPATVELNEMEPIFSISVPPEYFKRSDFAVLVDGHSMEPTIVYRSVVGTQRNFNFVPNELYVVQIPYEGIVVKRIAVSSDGATYVLKSDHPDKEKYPNREIGSNECEKIIMGRVVWIMCRY